VSSGTLNLAQPNPILTSTTLCTQLTWLALCQCQCILGRRSLVSSNSVISIFSSCIWSLLSTDHLSSFNSVISIFSSCIWSLLSTDHLSSSNSVISIFSSCCWSLLSTDHLCHPTLSSPSSPAASEACCPQITCLHSTLSSPSSPAASEACCPQITCGIQLCHLHLLQLHLKPAVLRSLVFIQLCHLHLLQLLLKPAVHRSLVFIQLCHLHLLQLHLKPAVHISFPSIPGSLSSAGVHWDLEPVHFHSQLLQHRLFASFSRVPCCRFCPLGVCCNSLQAIVDKYAVSQKMCQPIVTIILSNLKQILKFFYCCKSVKVATKQCITLPPRLSSVAVLPRETWIFKFVAFFAYFTVFQYKAATKVQPN